MAEINVQAEEVTSLDTNRTLQLDSEAEKRFLPERSAPHSCVSPTICREHPEYNLVNTSSISSQWRQTQCLEPISNPGHPQQANPRPSGSEPGSHKSTQPLVNHPDGACEPCRQKIWRKKREEAKMEPRPRTRPKPWALQTRDPNPAQNDAGQDIDL